MCFTLTIAADVPIPTIPFNGEGLWSEDLHPEHLVHAKFSLPHRKSLGTNMGCGCGFYYADWLEEQEVDPTVYGNIYGEGPERHVDYEGSIGVHILDEEVNPNQEGLRNLILNLRRQGSRVEIYGCWEHEWEELTRKRVLLEPARIVDRDFVFYEHYLYVVGEEK